MESEMSAQHGAERRLWERRVPFKLSETTAALFVSDHWLMERQQQVAAAGLHITDNGCHFWRDGPHGRRTIPISIYGAAGGGAECGPADHSKCL